MLNQKKVEIFLAKFHKSLAKQFLEVAINTKTHDGIIRMFNQHFVLPGKIDRELARQYNSLYTMRLTGDYGDCFDLQENDVLPLIEPAQTFIAKIWEMIESQN